MRMLFVKTRVILAATKHIEDKLFFECRVDRGLPWLQAEVCFLRLPPGFPAVPLYLSHTFGCSPAPHRTVLALFTHTAPHEYSSR